jgi:hypothetical protein
MIKALTALSVVWILLLIHSVFMISYEEAISAMAMMSFWGVARCTIADRDDERQIAR